MEITARELLDVEIREAFRGYHRDDVNDLLERAASTIEALSERLRQLSERTASAEGDVGRVRETEDILHRTLLLAQRAADEAVAEAQSKARQMIDEADVQARRMVADAEAEMRRRTESERHRFEEEIAELSSRRDALLADVEQLSRYEQEYRERVAQMLEADLAALRSRPTAAPGPKPELHALEVPPAREGVLLPDEPSASAGEPTRAIDAVAQFGNGARVPGASAPEAPAAERDAANAVPVEAHAGPTPATLDEREAIEIDLQGEEQALEAEVLDDDAFFATLREAVSDDAPLGPRDGGDAMFFDQDATNPGTFKELFKRRR